MQQGLKTLSTQLAKAQETQRRLCGTHDVDVRTPPRAEALLLALADVIGVEVRRRNHRLDLVIPSFAPTSHTANATTDV